MSDLKVTLKRIHAQRLREVYRSAGWPYQDVVEIDLLAAGLLERVTTDSGHAVVREGRIAWTGLSLRANVPCVGTDNTQWKMCQPDVFSIRNSSRHDYLEPIVHEIKVSRSDLLGDLKRTEKRGAYLEMGGQCWYVLGCDRSGHPIAKPNEIPVECGVMVFQKNQFEVTRMAPKRTVGKLPFEVWMALAKATPRRGADLDSAQVALTMP